MHLKNGQRQILRDFYPGLSLLLTTPHSASAPGPSPSAKGNGRSNILHYKNTSWVDSVSLEGNEKGLLPSALHKQIIKATSPVRNWDGNGAAASTSNHDLTSPQNEGMKGALCLRPQIIRLCFDCTTKSMNEMRPLLLQTTIIEPLSHATGNDTTSPLPPSPLPCKAKSLNHCAPSGLPPNKIIEPLFSPYASQR